MKTKSFDAVCCRSLHDVDRPQDIVQDRLGDVYLHQRDVLMGASVKNDLGPVTFEDELQPIAILDVGDDGVDLDAFNASALEVIIDLEDAVFVFI